MIEFIDVCKSFDGKSVLKNFNVKFDDGCYLLSGPSGIGKTTCIRLIANLLKPDSGEIRCSEIKSYSVCFQEDRLFENNTSLTNILAVSDNVSDEDVRDVIDKLLPEGTADKKVSELSGGMRRRVAVIRAMLHESDVVLLDEPFNGLDDDSRDKMISYIKESLNGRMLILTSHDKRGLDFCKAINVPGMEM